MKRIISLLIAMIMAMGMFTFTLTAAEGDSYTLGQKDFWAITVAGKSSSIADFELIGKDESLSDTYCADFSLKTASGNKYLEIDPDEYFAGNKAEFENKLLAVYDYLIDNYKDMAAKDPYGYRVLTQAAIWYVTNNKMTATNVWNIVPPGSPETKNALDRAVTYYALYDMYAELDAVINAATGNSDYTIRVFKNTTNKNGQPVICFDKNPTYEAKLSIMKTVSGELIVDWMIDRSYTMAEIYEILDDIDFYLYPSNKDAEKLGASVATGKVELDGMILFDPEVPEGWYLVSEVMGATASAIFDDVDDLLVYLKADGSVTPGEGHGRKIVSSKDNGTVVSHDGTGVQYVLPAVWDGALGGDSEYADLKAMGAQWIWDAENTYVYGESGDVFRTSFNVTADGAGIADLYLAADNAAVVYVNGKLAGYTEIAMKHKLSIGAPYDAGVFSFLDEDDFDGRWSEGWTHVYKIPLNLNDGTNTIQIIAANSKRTQDTGTQNDGYDETNNPCGVIFGFEIPGVAFDNVPSN